MARTLKLTRRLLPSRATSLRALLVSLLLLASCASCAAVRQQAKKVPRKPPTYGLAAMRVQRALGEYRTCYVEEERPAGRIAAYYPSQGCVHVDPGQLLEVERKYGKDAVDGILAHEFGHAIQHRQGDEMTQEGADAVAGCALYRLGESIEPLYSWLADHGGPPDPPLERRGGALASGYLACAYHETRSY